MTSRPTIAITSGEPAGIGPDICVLLAQALAQHVDASFVVIGDAAMLASRAHQRGVTWPPTHNVELVNVQLHTPTTAGHLDPANARYVLDTLDRAIAGCVSGEYAAMVTAPVHKGVINDAGVAFTGHTEYLAEKTNTARVVMMLTGVEPLMRVALASVHLALKDVPAAITRDSLTATLRIVHHDLRSKFGFADPRIVVAGLNPHAGEGGHLGREEIDVIAPVIAALTAEGMKLQGPLPADTLFTPRHLRDADAVLAMYHDQGLAPLKFASFGHGVNVTLGLPIIRTSVDHGTALDLAGNGDVDVGSMRAAIALAIELANKKR